MGAGSFVAFRMSIGMSCSADPLGCVKVAKFLAEAAHDTAACRPHGIQTHGEVVRHLTGWPAFIDLQTKCLPRLRFHPLRDAGTGNLHPSPVMRACRFGAAHPARASSLH